MSSSKSKRRKVFGTIAAQHDNLGDIVIRQAMVDLVSSPTSELHLSIGAMPTDYVDAFDLPPGTVTYRSTTALMRAFVLASIRREAALVLPPGPYPLTSWRSAARGTLSLAATLVARASGGWSVTLGKSVRGKHPAAAMAERALVRASDLYVTRDALSATVLGRPVRNEPDLAFIRQPTTTSDARSLCISLRYDKSVSHEVLSEVVAWARERHLTPILVTQVARDAAPHRSLARELKIDHLDWVDDSHADQLDRVRGAYQGAAIVVTDRLHAAILGALAGAAPVAVRAPSEPSKIVDALAGIVPVHTIDRVEPGVTRTALSEAVVERETVHQAALRATSQVNALRSEAFALR